MATLSYYAASYYDQDYFNPQYFDGTGGTVVITAAPGYFPHVYFPSNYFAQTYFPGAASVLLAFTGQNFTTFVVANNVNVFGVDPDQAIQIL